MRLLNTSLVVLADSFAPQAVTPDTLREVAGEPEPQGLIVTPVFTQMQYPSGLRVLVEPAKLQVTLASPTAEHASLPPIVLRYVLEGFRFVARRALGINFLGFIQYSSPEAEKGLKRTLVDEDFLVNLVGAPLAGLGLTLVYGRNDARCRLVLRLDAEHEGARGLIGDFNANFEISSIENILAKAEERAEWEGHFREAMAALEARTEAAG